LRAHLDSYSPRTGQLAKFGVKGRSRSSLEFG
jgi:hypothetical protein